jgi:hypothetical protein
MALPPVASWGTAAERRCHQEPTYVIFHAQIAEALLLAGEVELARGRKIVSAAALCFIRDDPYL